MDNLQNKINRLKRAVSDMHGMPAPEGVNAPMMDMNRDMTPNEICPDGSVPGPMGCPPPAAGPGCCVYQIGNQQVPIGMFTAEECAAQGGIFLGEGVECPKAAVKNLIKRLDRVMG